MPLEAIEPYLGVDDVQTSQEPGPGRIGNTPWHTATFEKETSVSTYQSGAPGAAKLVRNSLMDMVWRRAFGRPHPRADRPDSFVTTTLRTRLHMAYAEDDGAYHTMISGGTARTDRSRTSRAAQTAPVRDLMKTRYADAGFCAA